MNQPTSNCPMASPDQIIAPAPAMPPMLPIELLDASLAGSSLQT